MDRSRTRSRGPAAPLAALALALCAACGGDGAHEPPRRLLVVGWDGATYRMVDPLLRAGRLPNLARLIERGSTTRLASTRIPISSAAWVGAVTGRTPGETGVYGFFAPEPDGYGVSVISARSNRATPIWRALSNRGVRSVVVGVPVTYPPEPIDGVMVSGMLSPADADWAYPAGVADAWRARGFLPALGEWREERELTWPKVAEALEIKKALVRELLAEEDWSFGMVVFKNIDVASHRAYDGRMDTNVAALYEKVDEALGELLGLVGDDTDVIVMSDHGFATYERAFIPHSWLLARGFAVRRADAGPPPRATGPLAERRRAEHRQRVDELDLSATRVLSATCEGNFGGLRLNLAGREPAGIVEPAEAEALLVQLEAELRALRIPGTDTPLITSVERGPELYPGPHAGILPDLIFEADPSVMVLPLRGPRPFVPLDRPRPEHDRWGIFVAAGPSFARRSERGEAEVFDLAPTALHVLGLPVFEEMDGRVLTELLTSSRAPVVVPEASTPGAGRAPFPEDGGMSEREQAEIKRRLNQTGYVESR